MPPYTLHKFIKPNGYLQMGRHDVESYKCPRNCTESAGRLTDGDKPGCHWCKYEASRHVRDKQRLACEAAARDPNKPRGDRRDPKSVEAQVAAEVARILGKGAGRAGGPAGGKGGGGAWGGGGSGSGSPGSSNNSHNNTDKRPNNNNDPKGGGKAKGGKAGGKGGKSWGDDDEEDADEEQAAEAGDTKAALDELVANLEAVYKQAATDAKASPSKFWVQRRDDAKAELEAARAKQTAARQEARNPAEKQAIIHRQINKLNNQCDRAFARAEAAFHEIVAAEERQKEARQVYRNTKAKIEALEAQSAAIREAQQAEEAATVPPEKLQLEQMQLGTLSTTLRSMFENPLLGTEVREQWQSQQADIERALKALEPLAGVFAQGQASIESNRKKQEEEAKAAADALEARQQFLRATTGPPPPQPTPTPAQPTTTTNPTTTGTGPPAAAAASGGGGAGGGSGGTVVDSGKGVEDKEEDEEEEDDDEDEDVPKEDEKMERGQKGPLQFNIADTPAERPKRHKPTREDILGPG